LFQLEITIKQELAIQHKKGVISWTSMQYDM